MPDMHSSSGFASGARRRNSLKRSRRCWRPTPRWPRSSCNWSC